MPLPLFKDDAIGDELSVLDIDGVMLIKLDKDDPTGGGGFILLIDPLCVESLPRVAFGET